MRKKAIIISIKSHRLSNKEKILIAREKPWGLILFKRNIISLNQTRNLTNDVRKYARDKYFPILIDEEGSMVSRLGFINHGLNANIFVKFMKLTRKLLFNV